MTLSSRLPSSHVAVPGPPPADDHGRGENVSLDRD